MDLFKSLSKLTSVPLNLLLEISDSCLITGSSITCLLVSKVRIPVHDIDIFVCDFTVEKLEKVLELIQKHSVIESSKIQKIGSPSYLNLRLEGCKYVIQLVFCKKSVDQIFDGFDFEYGKAGLYQRGLVMRPEAEFALTSMECQCFGIGKKRNMRMNKVIKKGFKVHFFSGIYGKFGSTTSGLKNVDVQNIRKHIEKDFSEIYTLSQSFTQPIISGYSIKNQSFWFDVSFTSNDGKLTMVEKHKSIPLYLTIQYVEGYPCHTFRKGDQIASMISYIQIENRIKVSDSEQLYLCRLFIKGQNIVGKIISILPDVFLPIVVSNF